jgi:hypothetical protein
VIQRFVLPAVLMAGLATPAMADIGRIKIATGGALVERGTQKIPAKPGLVLEQGDTLVTARDGRMGVTFIDNTRFSAGPNSRIRLSEFQFNGTTRRGKFVTNLDRGLLAVVAGQIAKSEKNAMKVQTPTALLGVGRARFVVKVSS